MKISVIVNNYNYEKYLDECLWSIANQSYQPTEIIVVDDGSTDNSLSVIKEFASKFSICKVISQSNQGQLQAIINGCEKATGDVISFIDSDDMYKNDHLQKVCDSFTKDPNLGMRFCNVEKFGDEDSTTNLVQYYGNLGITTLYTYLSGDFLGNVTSSLSFSRSTIQKMLPLLYKHNERWRIRADNCFVWGASLIGATKENCESPSVLYRIHGSNQYAGSNEDIIKNLSYSISRENFISTFSNDIGLTDLTVRWLYKEYQTSEIRHPKRAKHYRRAIKSHRNPYSFARKLSYYLRLVGAQYILPHFKSNK